MDPSQQGQTPQYPPQAQSPQYPPQAPYPQYPPQTPYPQYPPQAPYPPSAPQPGYPYQGMPYPVPAPRKRSPLLIIGIVLLAVVVIAAIGVVAAGALLVNKDKGKVVITETQPSSCVVDNQVTSVNVGDTIYITGIFNDRVDANTPITMEVLLNGESRVNTPPVAHTTVDCLWDQETTTGWTAGHYTVRYRADGVVQAEGSFDIKEP